MAVSLNLKDFTLMGTLVFFFGSESNPSYGALYKQDIIGSQ